MSLVSSARSLLQSAARLASNNAALKAVLARSSAKLGPSLYYAQVAKEIAKQVYTKEKLAPPSLATMQEAQNVANQLFKSLKTGGYRQWTMKDARKSVVLAGEAFTFFLIGEMVGRRSMIGYDV